MPQVRQYQRQVEPKAAPAQRRALYPGPPTLQTPIQTQPSTEGAYAQFGAQIAKTATDRYARQVARQDEIRLTQAERQLSDWELARIYHPQQGALTVKGEAAFALPDQIQEDFQKTSDSIRSGLANDRQRMRFDQLSNQRHASVMGQIDAHVARETQRVDDQETQAYLKNEIGLAAANASDPLQVSTAIQNIQRRGSQYAERNGYGPEQTKVLVGDNVSQAHLAVIDRLLTTGDDLRAQAYFEHVKPEIDGTKLADVEKSLEEGSLRGKSQRYADTIGRDAETQQEAIDQAREIKDPKLRDLTEDRVIQDWQRKRQAQNDLAEQQAAQSKAMIDQTLKEQLNKIDLVHPKMARDIVPPSVWTSLDEQQRASLERYTKQYQEDGPAGRKTNQSVWYALMQEASNDPKKFASRNLYASIDKLSDSDFQSLVSLQNSVRKGDKPEADKQLDGIRTNDRIITGTLRKAGIDPEDKENKARVDLLWQKVDEQVQILQRNTNKKASNDDIQGIVDGLLIEEAGKKGSWWSILPGGAPFFDQPGVKRFEIEGRATNPATGEKMIFVNGAWVKE